MGHDIRNPRRRAAAPADPAAALLTHEEVVERSNRFYDLLRKERELQDFLVRLELRGGPPEVVIERKRKHDEALAEIDRIRFEEMVPILEELSRFIAAVEALEREHEAARAAAGRS